MATSDSQKSFTYNHRYKLVFGPKIKALTESIAAITIVQNNELKLTDENDKHVFTLMLYGVKINKKIYQPNEIEAELDFVKADTNGESTLPEFDDVSKLLSERKVTVSLLRSTNNDKLPDTVIAEDYYVHELNPQVLADADGNRKMTVKLRIYSMDKLMTLSKYSKAYVARKLGSGILQVEAINFGMADTNTRKPLIRTNTQGLRFLRYNQLETITIPGKGSMLATIPSEFIHPYLVQYNESFYDFLVRCANRYGEFLYFEDGRLNLGLADSKPIEIDDYQSVTTQTCVEEPFNVDFYRRDPMKDMEEDSKVELNAKYIDKRDDGFPADAFPENNKFQYNAEAVNDEYLFPLFKDKFTNFERERKCDKPTNHAVMAHVLPFVKHFLESEFTTWYIGLIVSAVQSIIVDEGIEDATTIAILKFTGGNNAPKNLHHIKPYDSLSEQSNGNKVVQFGGLDPKSWMKLSDYSKIKKHQYEQQQKMICIDMGVSYADVKLGQKIKLNGLKSTYVVVQIVQKSEGEWKRNYEQYGKESNDNAPSGRSQKIYAIPAYEEDKQEKFIPPVQPVPIIRRVGPQAAFVTDNDDPKCQGRVRVMYPWQTSSELISLKKKSDDAATRLKEAQTAEENAKKRKAEQLAELTKDKELLYDIKKFLAMTPEDRKKELKAMKAKLDKKEYDKKIKESELKILESQIKELADIKEPTTEQKGDLAIKEAELNEKKKEAEKAKADYDKAKGEYPVYQEAHEHKLDSKNNGKDKNPYNDNDNPVVIRLSERISKKKEYLAVCSEHCKEAEAEKVAAEKNNKQMKEVMEAVYQTLSSPWIRVATPMATFHGGTYFKPRIGDEVLVGYDNGNIERPYVLGSLYSKNVLDPQELIERRYSPENQWANVSMAMVSPNGHHITFTDPPGGLGFLTNAVSPGLGMYAGMAGLNTSIGASFKDLNGGIHIGDRYGIYEIEMQTHKRSIDIRSPFGTVGINAFTGITINAPNGDVTIRGKNIKLEAGNKITINSGTNLPVPDYGDSPSGKTTTASIGKAIVGGVAGAVTDMFAASVIDISLVRHIIEVYVRPVDGTLLLKSRKFLKLEAGLGKATVKRDRFKKTTLDGLKGTEEFYKLLISHVRVIDRAVDQYFKNYKELHVQAYQAKTIYESIAKTILTDVENPNLAKKAYNNLAQIPGKLTADDFEGKFLDGLIGKDKWGKEVKGKEAMFKAIEKEANNYMKSAWALYKHAQATTLASLIELHENNVTNDEFKFVAKASQSVMEGTAETNWIVGHLKKWDDMYKDGNDKFLYLPQLFNDDPLHEKNRLYFKRVLLLFFIHQVFAEQEKANKTAVQKKMYITIGFDPKKIINEKDVPLRLDYWWKRQVDVMDHCQQNSLLRTLYDSIWKQFKDKWKANFAGLKDKQVWDDSLEGQILFSDQEDSTMSFEGEGVHRETDANQGTMEHLKWILRDIK